MPAHIRSLDGLRGLAAMIVVVSHVSNRTGILDKMFGIGAGQIGVMIFFVLSGFLMGHLYFRSTPQPANVGMFFQRRLARVVPLYLVLVIASFSLWMIFDDQRYWLYPVTSENLAQHLLMIDGVSVFWTIPMEIQFYLLFPLLWFLRTRIGNGFGLLLLCLIALGLLSHLNYTPTSSISALRYVGHYFVAGLLIAHLGTPDRYGRAFDFAFVGCLLGVLLLYPKIGHFVLSPGERMTARALEQAIWSNPVYLLVVALLVGVTIRSGLANAVLGSGIPRFLGTISYSLYLLHLPCFWCLQRWTSLSDHPKLFSVLAIVLAVAVASASYFAIERPARYLVNGLRFGMRRSLPAE